MQEFFITLAGMFIQSVPNFMVALLILAATYYLANLSSRLLKSVLVRQNAEPGVSHLLSRILKWVIIAFGLIAALQRFFDVTAFLTGLGIIGFTVGFALQNIMQNFVSGIILLIQQPFRMGDNVSVAGNEGTVLKIGLRTTEMKTFDGRIVFLPNAEVLSQPIINYTRAVLRRVELPIGVSYDANHETVRKAILEEIKSVPGYLGTPDPLVLFHTFGDSSIDLNVLFWVDTTISSHIVAKDVALTRIKKAYMKKNIEIPYPIQTVRMPEKKQSKRGSK